MAILYISIMLQVFFKRNKILKDLLHKKIKIVWYRISLFICFIKYLK